MAFTKNYGFIILITHELKAYLPLVDDISGVLWICYHGNNDVLFKKTSQVRHVRRWFSDSVQNFQLDTTFKPFGPVRDIFDPWAPGLSFYVCWR